MKATKGQVVIVKDGNNNSKVGHIISVTKTSVKVQFMSSVSTRTVTYHTSNYEVPFPLNVTCKSIEEVMVSFAKYCVINNINPDHNSLVRYAMFNLEQGN